MTHTDASTWSGMARGRLGAFGCENFRALAIQSSGSAGSIVIVTRRSGATPSRASSAAIRPAVLTMNSGCISLGIMSACADRSSANYSTEARRLRARSHFLDAHCLPRPRRWKSSPQSCPRSNILTNARRRPFAWRNMELPLMRLHERAENRIHAAEMPLPLFPKPFQHVGIEAQMNRGLARRRHHHNRVPPEILIHGMNGRVRTGASFAIRTLRPKSFGRVLPRIVACLHRPLSTRRWSGGPHRAM